MASISRAFWAGYVTRSIESNANQLQWVVASGTPRRVTLDSLPALARAEIVAIDWARIAVDEGKRLRALGIDEGARVAVAHRGIFGGRDPIALIVGRMTVALRREHARAMTVEQV